MRPMAVLASVFALLAAAVTLVWLGQVNGDGQAKPSAPVVEKLDLPTPAATGPHPKITIEEKSYDFGVLLHGEKGKHEFVIKNDGEAPLQIKKESSTCQCTGAEMNGDAIAPGASSIIAMSWEIRSKTPKFEHSATLRTNDPDMPTLTLTVKGLVGLKLITLPEGDWNMGLLNDSDPGVAEGFIASSVAETFEITSIESSSPFLKAESMALAGDELTHAKMAMIAKTPALGEPSAGSKDFVKAVHRIRITTTERGKQGTFSESVKIVTSIPDTDPIHIPVKGVNPGAFQFFPIGGNAQWHAQILTLNAGDIDPAQGKKMTLLMIARGLNEDLQITDFKADPPFLKVSLEPTSDPTGGRQARIVIDIPPGSPAVTRTTADPATINFKTNHPLADAMTLKVLFHSR